MNLFSKTIYLGIFCMMLPAFGQSIGTISGTVIDKGNGEGLPTASIRVQGTDRTAFSDLNGAYAIRGMQEGTYTLVAEMGGFNTVTVEGVKVVPGETTTINIDMAVSSFEQELVVTAELLENTEVGLLKHRQKSIAISDAISGEEISRAGGSTAADAVTKITGASVVDGKYVFIRGLGDRYTSTHMNGVEMPTADPDVKAFQADLFPATVLENVVTLKSFTPDKPGNFSGGIIDIGTKSYPSDFNVEVSLKSSLNTQTTFNDDYLFYEGSGQDWLGQDGGLRELPDVLDGGEQRVPSLFDARTNEADAQLLDRISNSFEPVMSHERGSAALNSGLSASIGDQRYIFNRRLGYLATFSYGRNRTYIDDWRTARWKLTENAPDANSLINQSDFQGEEGTEKVNWGGLLNLNYGLSDNHELGFNFIYTQGGESTSQYYVGQWPEQFSSDNAFLESRLLKYTERNLNSYQMRGEHFFPNLGSATLEWNASSSATSQYEPDTRIFTDNFSVRDINGEEQIFYSITPSIYNNPARYWRDLNEDSDNISMDVSVPFSGFGGLKGRVKVGGIYEQKERDFEELRYEYNAESNVRYDGDPDFFFGPENTGLLGYDERRDRYIFGNVLQLSPDSRGGNYGGEMDIQAFYAMVEAPLTEKLKMITGLRQESAEMRVFNADTTGLLDNDDTLPSLHFIYEWITGMNVRMSYGRTLARPTFREKAPYSSFDFIADGIFAGNPDLERTLIDNFDLRWEWFNRPGELMAASVFYKEFENPIERAYNIRQASEFGEKTFLNVPEATVQGLELEFRRRFDQAVMEHGSNHVFSVSANLSLIDSEVDIPEEEYALIVSRDPDASPTRTLQGQSPYLVNIGINYDNFANRIGASLFYNVFGERLDQVGYGGAPNAFEQPRNMLDFTYTQAIWENLSFKFTAKNLLDDAIQITQEFKGNEFIQSEFKTGRNFSLSVSYKP